MMLTIQGLPTSTSYQELKRLIKQECNITDFILDSLVLDDDGCKKVRIGVTDDGEGSLLMKYLNGYHYSGHVIRVMPVGKTSQQQNHGNFDARGGYQQRNDYSNNFGNRVMPHENQAPRSNTWSAQWGQGVAAQQPQHAFPNQPIQSVVNNNFTHQQSRGFVSGGVPQHAQNFGYAAKGNVLEVPITTLKDNFQGSGQFHHQAAAQGHFQGQAHVQPSPWNAQVQPTKPQVFDKQTAGGYNQGFNDNRAGPKPSMGNDGYKDYDKGDRRFAPTRDSSPGRRPLRMSPDNLGRRMSPAGPQGRRMSPPGHQSRRMSPPGHQSRRMSPSPSGPPGRRISPGNHGRRMSPPRMGGPVPVVRGMSPIPGRRMSPSRQGISHHGHKLSPGAQGRRMSPGSYRRGSPQGPQGRRISPVGPQGRRVSPVGPHGRRLSPPGLQGRRLSPPDPQGRRLSPPGPQGRRMSPVDPQDRRLSPPGLQGRRLSPPALQGRRLSPSGPQGRRVSPSGPPGRRISPSGPRGQRDSPHGIPGRRMSPGRRELSPGRRLSPTDRRRVSPGRHGSPRPKRHSPGRRSVSPRRRSPLSDPQAGMRGYPPSYQQPKKPKYDDDEGPQHLKHVRPAYEPPTKAPNQAMYSGGYRPNARENVQYSAPNARPDPWQQSGDKPATYPPVKLTDSRMEKFEVPRGSEHIRMGDAVKKRSRSGTRDSRSPVRRDRSPFKDTRDTRDRYKRHSPSPRSPRRSWALEKRRSPDDREAPPPPVWPGQNSREPEFPRQNRQHFSDRNEKIVKKPEPTWERSSYQDKNDGRMDRREKDPEPRTFTLSPAVAKESLSRKNFRQEGHFPENIRESHSYTAKEQFRRPNSVERMPYTEKPDFREYPTKKGDHDELHRKKEIPPRRDDFVRDDEREPFRTNTAQLNMEIEDVYKRVAELGKKAQEYRKKDNRFDDDRDDQFFSQNENEMQRGRDARREFHSDIRFQPRDEEMRSRQSNEAKSRQRESRWSAPDTSEVWRPKKPLSPAVKAKRDKAAEELTRRIINKFKDQIREHQKSRIQDELTLSISRILFDMFKHEDISYIELIIKFNKKYDANDEQKLFEEVMSSFSSNYRKRMAPDPSEVPVKTAKHIPDAVMKDGTKGIDFPQPPRVMRLRKTNAALDNRSFQPPRANLSIDNLKPKHKPESKVWSHEANVSNIESKPMLVKKWVQKTKILNKETNDQAQKLAVKTKFQRIPQRFPGALKNPVVQKKNLLTPPKTKASVQLPEEIISAPKINKSTKASNVQAQKTVPQEMPVTPKPKLDNDTTTLKIKAQENDTSTPRVNTNNKSTPVQTPETIAKPKSPLSEDAPRPNPTEEKKDQEIQKDDKGNTSETTAPERQSTDQSKSEGPSKEKVELDPLLARAVEEELQDIMIQVWQELPDDPSEEEDRLAVDLLRNEAGDDLRRVLGLNITKRLLNIYNNLFVKMQFTCRPQMGCLTSFLNEYHISKFKRIDKNFNTFAAQMENIEDFDRVCAAKEIMCGEAKVSITPCYKFTQCPDNLKTIYDDTYFYEYTVQENTESPKSKNTTQKAKFTAANKNAVKQAANKNAVKQATKAENVDTKPTDKTETQETADSANNDSKCVKKDLENKSVNMINDKPDETETKKSIDLVSKDSEDLKNNSTTVEEDKANDSSNKITDDLKSKKEEVTENIMNEKQINIDTLHDKDISEFIVKDKLEIDDDDGDLELGIPECQMEGDEELDDEDILALMSEGVVLDECSGSENEN